MPDRPRDELGRPLPWDTEGFPGVPVRTTIDGVTAVAEAREYLGQGLPFHAHEVLEQRWRCCPPAERPAWRALAQWAAALTHQARGNAVGTARLAERALCGLDACPHPPQPVDADLVRASLAQLITGPGTDQC